MANRRIPRRVTGLLVLLAAMGVATPAAAEWRRIDSPNFIVMGEIGARELRDIAVKFEGFRETLARVLSERATSTAVPTVVIVFSSDRAFTPFKPRFNGKPIELSGLFVPRQDVNYIAIVSDGRPDRFNVVFHEYAHLVISNTGRRVPAWLDEGLAEFYSTFELSRGGREALLGSPLAEHLGLLNDERLLTLEQLLTVDHDSPMYNEGARRSVFYAQAWALTHLVLLGEPIRAPKLTVYIDALSRGNAPMQAWRAAFGSDDLGRELQGYIRQQTFRAVEYKFSAGLTSFDATASTMARADAEAILADFLLEQGRITEAADRLAAVEAIDSRGAAVGVEQARLAVARKDERGADALLRRTADIEDWFLRYLAGTAVADLARIRMDRPEPAQVDAARQLFANSSAGRAELPNAVARMAELDLRSAAGPSADTRAALERARRAAPGRLDYTLLYAQILARQSDFAAARDVLGPLMTPSTPANIREIARAVMGNVVQAEASQTARTVDPSGGRSAATTTTAATAATTTTETAETSGASIPVFRDLKPGETRMEGVLERISCAPGRPIVFHLKTRSGAVTASAAQLTDVDFVTFRDDITGSVGCGPMKQLLDVYLTWRAGAAGARIVVAIEFLPKKGLEASARRPPAIAGPK